MQLDIFVDISALRHDACTYVFPIIISLITSPNHDFVEIQYLELRIILSTLKYGGRVDIRRQIR